MYRHLTSTRVGQNYAMCRTITSITQHFRRGTAHLSEREDSRNGFIRPVSKANVGDFYQKPPSLGNVYTQDSLLVRYLQRVIPQEVYQEIKGDLEDFGHKIGNKIDELGRECEANLPQLQHFDAWGRRVDIIKTSEAWKEMHNISAQEGIIAIPYEKEFKQWSRLYQGAKLFMFNSSSGLYSCPLAMTDGAAKILMNIPMKDSVFTKAYNHLTSRIPSKFWTSGQWMTEKRGGSDVANGTETVAVRTGTDTYKLYGYKWFTSATDSDMAITLARIVDENGNWQKGSKGISLFYLETRDRSGALNNLEVQRLKNKLGTRQVPTAELILDGTEARLISEPGRGVAGIAPMLTITRIHNSISAASGMRRMLQYSRDYATKRSAFGNKLITYPSHMKVLFDMEVECEAAFLFNMEIFRLIGLSENGLSSESDEYLIRFLTPILKLYTAKQAVSSTSEGLETFGGQGYMEDTGLPTLYRDAQVLSIWEGTTNVLSLDVLRSIVKSKGKVLEVFITDVEKKLSCKSEDERLLRVREKLIAALSCFGKFLEVVSTKPEDYFQTAARDFSYSAARIYMGALIYNHACSSTGSENDLCILQRWCMQDLTPMVRAMEEGLYDTDWRNGYKDVVMSGYESK